MESITTVINLIGGPGCGKSTIAADLYAQMKRKRMKVEMVREVAKEWAWEGKAIGPFEQLAILGEQIKKESSLYRKVKYVVTDSPVLLGSFYFEHNHKQTFANGLVKDFYHFSKRNGIRYVNVVLPRTKAYEGEGRFETEKQAVKLDAEIVDYLDDNFYNYTLYPFNRTDSEIIAELLETIDQLEKQDVETK